jgi:hypothetical protein
MLVVGCRYVVSFDGFSGGVQETTTGNGGSTTTRTTSTSSDGAGGSTGDAGTEQGGAGVSDLDATPSDTNLDTTQLVPPPTLVYSAPPGASIRGIAVFGPDLYWVEGGLGRGIFRMRKDGDAGTTSPIFYTTNAYDVAVDAKSIYWTEGSPSYQAWQMPITGGVNTTPTSYFSHNSSFPGYIAIDDSAILYVTTIDTGRILSGSAGSSANPYVAQSGIAGIAFYSVADAGVHDLLWGYGAGIRYGPPGGSGPGAKDLYTGSSDPVQGVATDGQEVFWISNEQAIKRGDLATAATPRDVGCSPPRDLGHYADIAVDDRWVYFTWPSKNQIYKCLK